jgi:hypothetical protein
MLSSVDDVTRLEEAQQELQSAIMRLPDDAWFDIIAYNTTLMVWKGQLTQATTATRSDARRFIYSLFGDGKTALYDALEDGLTVDPNLEAMLFLSDGDPTAGKIVDRARIVQEITAQNSSRRIAIDVLGIDSAGPAEDFLKQLAAANFGTYRAVR